MGGYRIAEDAETLQVGDVVKLRSYVTPSNWLPNMPHSEIVMAFESDAVRLREEYEARKAIDPALRKTRYVNHVLAIPPEGTLSLQFDDATNPGSTPYIELVLVVAENPLPVVLLITAIKLVALAALLFLAVWSVVLLVPVFKTVGNTVAGTAAALGISGSSLGTMAVLAAILFVAPRLLRARA